MCVIYIISCQFGFFFAIFNVADALGLDKVNVNVPERRSDTESSVGSHDMFHNVLIISSIRIAQAAHASKHRPSSSTVT